MKKTFVFPQIMEDNDEPGMTLRDYFAGLAMEGIMASNRAVDPCRDPRECVSIEAYALADAMLTEREKGKE